VDIIKIDTDRAATAANNIAKLNNKIQADFSQIESAMKALDNVWNSSSAREAINSFHMIKSAYYEARYEVVENYAEFLHTQVDAGYELIESNNKMLASRFK
jgi:transposase-like protein